MQKILRGAAVAVATTIALSVPASTAHAAQLNQLCRTNAAATLYFSPTTGITVPANSLVRILDWRGDYHYLARWDGNVGQLERSKVNQASCYFQ